MTEVRIPDGLLARLPEGARTADFLRAARSGASLSKLGAAWTPEFVAWFYSKGYGEIADLTLLPETVPSPRNLALEEARARRGATLLYASGALLLVLSALPFLLVSELVRPGQNAGLYLPTCVLAWALLPLLPLLLVLALLGDPDAIGRTAEWLGPRNLAFAVLCSLLALLGFALVAKGNRHSPLLALLGIFGLFARSRGDAT